MRSIRSGVSTIAVVLALLPGAALAKDDPMKEGFAAEKAGQWSQAADAWKRAIAQKPTPQARYHLALAEQHQDQILEAIADLEQADRDAVAQKVSDVHASAQKLLPELKKKLAQLTIDVPARPGLVVTLDGKEVPSSELRTAIAANPGTHQITASSDDSEPARRSVTLSPGGDETVSIKLKRQKPAGAVADADQAPASGSRTAAWVALGLGGVGLAAGTVFGLTARSQRNTLSQLCPGNVCPPEAQQTYDKGKLNANLSTAGFAIGGVGVLVGVILFATGKEPAKATTTAHVEPWIGAGSAGLAGAF